MIFLLIAVFFAVLFVGMIGFILGYNVREQRRII